METQVRVYRIEPGRLETFVREWREPIVPLRRRFGFEVLGPRASVEEDTSVRVLAHARSFAETDRASYLSLERAALDPDPARLVVEPRMFLARPIPLR
jgi:hypothetical protein